MHFHTQTSLHIHAQSPTLAGLTLTKGGLRALPHPDTQTTLAVHRLSLPGLGWQHA